VRLALTAAVNTTVALRNRTLALSVAAKLPEALSAKRPTFHASHDAAERKISPERKFLQPERDFGRVVFMDGCSCPHEVNEHAPAADFGQRICLMAGCECNGTHEEVVTAYVQRSMGKRRVLHDLTDVIRKTIEIDRGVQSNDNLALIVATEILRTFNVEKKS
jgi:hypothetical protein